MARGRRGPARSRGHGGLNDRAGCLTALLLEVARHHGIPLVEPLASSPSVDGPALRDGGEPSSRVVRDPVLRPLPECFEHRLLREVLGLADVPDEACERRHDAGGFDAPYGGEGAPGAVGVGVIRRRDRARGIRLA